VTRVLVTGASGFIGRHSLAPLIERGYEVHAVARGAVPAPSGLQIHACDLLDDRATAALIRAVAPSHLLHFAWYAMPGRFWTAPENLDWAAASLRLLRSFAEAGGRRAVLAGSCAEYDWSQPVLGEAATPLTPHTLYGAAKNAVRSCLEAAAEALGISWAWGRIFWVYGPHEPRGRLVSDVAAGLLSGARVNVSTGIQIRDFMHVEDVARAFVALLDSELRGPVNIATGLATPIRDLVARLGALTGAAERIDFGTRTLRPDEPLSLVGDATRLTAELGFAPRYDLERGLALTVDWWRQEGSG